MTLTRNVIFEDAFGQGAGASVVGTGSDTGSGTGTVTVPGGTAEGDLVVFALQTVNSIPDAAGPSGGATWAEAYRFDTSSNEFQAVYWKVCGSSEPSDWTITQSGSQMTTAAVVFRTQCDGLWSFASAVDTLTPSWVVSHPYGLQVVVYMDVNNTITPITGQEPTTAINVDADTNCRVIVSYRNTKSRYDAQPVRCLGDDSAFSTAINMVFYPS